MITRKTRDQIALMRRAGKVVAEMHEVGIRAAKPGATTADVDEAAREVLDRRGARSNFLGYGNPPFPGVVCTSPNEVIVHGIPSEDVVLHEGDILSIDCGAIIEGWHGDAAVTVPVGDVDDESKRLLEVTRASLEAAIEHVMADNRLGDIGAAVEGVAERAGFSVVREYVGHGIGTAMHEEPQIPNYGPPGRGLKLKEGMKRNIHDIEYDVFKYLQDKNPTLAIDLGIPAYRKKVAEYAARADRVTERERLRALTILEQLRKVPPSRSAGTVDAELRAIRAARRMGGRRLAR